MFLFPRTEAERVYCESLKRLPAAQDSIQAQQMVKITGRNVSCLPHLIDEAKSDSHAELLSLAPDTSARRAEMTRQRGLLLLPQRSPSPLSPSAVPVPRPALCSSVSGLWVGGRREGVVCAYEALSHSPVAGEGSSAVHTCASGPCGALVGLLWGSCGALVGPLWFSAPPVTLHDSFLLSPLVPFRISPPAALFPRYCPSVCLAKYPPAC